MTDADDQLKKFYLTEEVKGSGMLPSDRLIMMFFIDLAELYGDGQFWAVPEHRTPSHTDLKEWTGLGRSTVAARLNHLERTGWIKRSRPATADALGRGERTLYWLAVGERVERDKPARPANPTRPAPPEAAADSPTVGAVQSLDEGSPATEPVQPLDGGSPTVGAPLVQPLDGGSPTVGHNNQPPTGVGSTQDSHLDQQTPPSTADAAAAAPLPGLETTETTPPPTKPKRKRATKAPAAPKPPTEGQRVNALAKRYTDVVKLSPFQAVRAVVAAAVKTGDYTDEQIGAALDRLAAPDTRRSVTANTLRIALEGDRPGARAGGHQPFRNPTSTDRYREEL